MKKLVFLFAMIFAVSMAMAQNVGSVTQNGNDNIGVISQDGSGNEGIVDQLKGNNNSSSVIQTGNDNYALSTQGMLQNYYPDDRPGHEGEMLTSTEMIGSSNIISIKQVGEDYAEVLQTGSNNKSTVNQAANGNAAWSYQGWPYGFWGETVVTSALKTTNGVVSINQLSANNTAATWTYGGDNNKTTISQSVGEGNSASVAQGFIYVDAPYNFSTPVYNVKDNIATIAQAGASNTGKVMQLGNTNTFKLTQTGDGNSVGYDATASSLLDKRNAYFKQDGSRNTFTGTQTDGSLLKSTSGQFGNDNTITLVQNDLDVAEIIQDGNWNVATVKQYGGGQDAYVGQFGSGNTATITQQQ